MGMMKNYYIDKNYGFILLEDNKRQIFVHKKQLELSGITVDILKEAIDIKVSFEVMEYMYNDSLQQKACSIHKLDIK